MKDALIVTDRDGKIRAINAAAETITGWNAGEATGHLLGEVFQIDSKPKGQANTASRLLSRYRQTVPIEGRAVAICDAKDGLESIHVHFSMRRRNVVTWPKHPETLGPHPDAA